MNGQHFKTTLYFILASVVAFAIISGMHSSFEKDLLFVLTVAIDIGYAIGIIRKNL